MGLQRFPETGAGGAKGEGEEKEQAKGRGRRLNNSLHMSDTILLCKSKYKA